MTHNGETYPDPYAFKPERYFDNDGKLMNDKVFAYGFGRRQVHFTSFPGFFSMMLHISVEHALGGPWLVLQ